MVSRNYRKRANQPGTKGGKTRTVGRNAARQTLRDHEARKRGFAAINGVRKGKYKSLSAAARAERTTVESIKRLLPGALLRSRPGKRLRVRASDRYTQLVEILDSSGEASRVIARGSHERELAGRHRAACFAVLEHKQPASILRQFRGKKVGGRKLLTNPDRLFDLGRGGVEDLDDLYVSPEASR